MSNEISNGAKLIFESGFEPGTSTHASKTIPGHESKDRFRVGKDGLLETDERAFNPEQFSDGKGVRVIYPKDDETADPIPARPMYSPRTTPKLSPKEYMEQLLDDSSDAHSRKAPPNGDDECGMACQKLLNAATNAAYADSHDERKQHLVDCCEHLEAACRAHRAAK